MAFESGKWLIHCDRCGFERKSDQVVKTWDNFIVCKPDIKAGCFETRHPQDFVRSKIDDTRVPFVRRQPTQDVFVARTINCDVLDFTYLPYGLLDVGSHTVTKSRITGPVTVTGTITVECTLEIR